MLIVAKEGLVARPRLEDLIERPSLASITLVTAPAGYGKSTLASQWARSTERGVAWVALGPESNTTGGLLAQIVAAIQSAFQADVPAEMGSFDDVVDCLDALARAGRRPVVVLDDLNQVENQEAYEAMAGVLGRLPDGVHMILISRTVPALPLGRLRAQGRVRELTEDDLRFTPAETSAIVGNVAPERLTADQVATLGARTEGWIAGIRLALASLERVDSVEVQSIVDTWPVSHWLDDYVVEEVLGGLPEVVREFVLRTANLPELTPQLCDEVLGIETSAALIDEVRRRLVFVRPVDVNGDALAYHALFAESAGRIADRALPVSDRRERLRRAALWYERAGRLEAAIDQAVAAEDWEIAERCIRPLCRELMDRDSHHSRLHWLSKLPEARVLADPDMARWYISALQYTGQIREAQRAFVDVEPRWQASGDPAQLGYAASTRTMFASMNGELDLALELSHEALRHFPPDYAVDRMHSWTGVMQFEFQRGDDEAVAHAYRQAALCRERLPAEQWWWTALVEPDRANHLALRGDLRAAWDLAHELLTGLPATYRRYEAKIRAFIAAIALEWDRLDVAARHVPSIERDLEDFPLQIWHQDALLVVARVYEAMGDNEQSAATLLRLRELQIEHGGRRLQYRLEAVQVPAWLDAGQLGRAKAWAEHAQIADQPWVRVFGDLDPRLMRARVHLAGGQAARAGDELSALQEQAVGARRWAELVPLCAWQAVVRLDLGDEDGALAAFRTALHHGMRGGFVRSFLTPGYDLAPFLRRVREHLTADEIAYAHRVIGGNGNGRFSAPSPTASDSSNQNCRSSLSERELQVLGLLHAGCTNQEIAERLYITERTVKKHVGNILRKLAVKNRTAAALRALEMGLVQ